MTERNRFDYFIRKATPMDEAFLWEMLYHAIYVPGGISPPPDIVSRPELSRYVREWGRVDDVGLLAIDATAQRPIGAAWLRLLTADNAGYGYTDDETPELSMAVLPQYRGRGVGTALLTSLLEETESIYKAVSLSVSAGNPAVRLYERVGFKVAGSTGASLTMKRSRAVDA
jgi:GNAT superfamily N-acetyltransferase